MKQYEYLVINCWREDVQVRLNYLGEKGWQVVGSSMSGGQGLVEYG